MNVRVMVDLETLSSRHDAVVVSIGAVPFSAAGPDMGRTFYDVLELKEQEEFGRHIDANTVKWWMEQSDQARSVFKEKATKTDVALGKFSHFLFHIAETAGVKPEQVQIYGYGSTFDNVVLRSLYQTFGLKCPWSYRGDLCFRTLVNLGKNLGIEEPKREGTHHNALDDACHQARGAGLVLTRLGIA